MATLQISNRTVRLDGRTYNLRSVSSIDTAHGVEPRPFKGKTIGYALMIFVVGVFLANADGFHVFGVWTAIISGAFTAFVIYRNTRPRDFWILQLEVAGVYSRLVASKDKHSIDQAYSQICAALEADAPFQSTVNISDSTIVNDSVLKDSPVTNTSNRK